MVYTISQPGYPGSDMLPLFESISRTLCRARQHCCSGIQSREGIYITQKAPHEAAAETLIATASAVTAQHYYTLAKPASAAQQ